MSKKDTYLKLGQLARQLHESLKQIEDEYTPIDTEQTKHIVSKAQKRLSYVEKLTSDAASKVMDHAEEAKAKIDKCLHRTKSPKNRQDLIEIDMLLTEIIVAQEFQDLTGQILKKVFTTLADVESQLIGTLIEHSDTLNGPTIPSINKDNLGKADLDNLLDSLGF